MVIASQKTRVALACIDAMKERRRHVCVGLDPDPDHKNWPRSLTDGSSSRTKVADAVFTLCTEVVMATRDIAAAYKPNLGFYLGLLGDDVDPVIDTLQGVTSYIREHAPESTIVLDGKFGDLAATNAKYARFAYDAVGADAVTLSPYAGPEAVRAFGRKGKLSFVLCRMSNKDAGHVQDLILAKRTKSFGADHQLFEFVAGAAARGDYGEDGIGLVAGATNPDLIKVIRSLAPEAVLLIPGIGKQQGELEASVHHAKQGSCRFLINSSSGILHASGGPDYAEVARTATLKLHDEIVVALGQR